MCRSQGYRCRQSGHLGYRLLVQRLVSLTPPWLSVDTDKPRYQVTRDVTPPRSFIYSLLFVVSEHKRGFINGSLNVDINSLEQSASIQPVNISRPRLWAKPSRRRRGNGALAVSGLEDYYGLFLFQHVLMTTGRCCHGESKYRSGAE